MAYTTTRQAQQTQAQPATSKGQVAVLAPPRLLPPEQGILQEYGVDPQGWRVLVESIFPAAKTPMAVMMALDYCKRRKLDVYKHPVHIVPIWNSAAGDNGKGAMVETIWPGINELRTTAIRTGQYAGMEVPTFGPVVTTKFEGKIKKWANGSASWEKVEATVSYPEWCQITVYRTLGTNRVPFPGPRVYWLETYARIRNDCDVPNSMWEKRANGQIEKCAEAAALRRAFPEEIGSDYSIDEIGAFTTHAPTDITDQGTATVVPAQEPRREDPQYQSQPVASPHSEPAEGGQPDAPPVAGDDSKPEAASAPAVDTKKADPPAEKKPEPEKSKVTDVEDQNAKQPAPDPDITFEDFKTARAFFEFSDTWLEDPKRTPAEAAKWEAYYHDKIGEMQTHSYERIREAVASTLAIYHATMKRGAPA